MRARGSQYRRLCARAGCGAPAAATLRFQPTLRHAWLVDLDETAARTQGDLCNRHAAALVLPRGWELHDERTNAVGPRPAEVAESADETPRRVRVRRRAAVVDAEPEREPTRLPGFEPPVVESNGHVAPAVEVAEAVEAVDAVEAAAARAVPAQFGANDDDVGDEALDAVLDARTPLLQRAFRNAKPNG